MPSFPGFMLTEYGRDHWVYVQVALRDHTHGDPETELHRADWTEFGIYSASDSTMPFANRWLHYLRQCFLVTGVGGYVYPLSQDTERRLRSHFDAKGHEISLGMRGASVFREKGPGLLNRKSNITPSVVNGVSLSPQSGDLRRKMPYKLARPDPKPRLLVRSPGSTQSNEPPPPHPACVLLERITWTLFQNSSAFQARWNSY